MPLLLSEFEIRVHSFLFKPLVIIVSFHIFHNFIKYFDYENKTYRRTKYYKNKVVD